MEKSKYLLALIIACVLCFVSCGKTDQNKTTAGDNNQQQPQDIKKDAPTDNTQPGQQKTDSKNDLGIKEGLPSDYPPDLPQPKGAKVLGSLNTSEGTTVTFESPEKPTDIAKSFGDDVETKGFKRAQGDLMKDEGGMILWQKDKREVSLMVAWDKDKKTSSVVVTYK